MPHSQVITNDIKAIFYLKGTENIQQAMGGASNEEEDPVKSQMKQVLGTCYSNMAACLLKEEKWPRVIEYCKKALEADPKNKKAHFRIAQAYIRTGKLDLARQELQDLLRSDPDGMHLRVLTHKLHDFLLKDFLKDAGVKRELALLKEKDKIETSKEKKIYKNMFERMAKQPDN
ncbi:hypothetical protein NQZ79_g2521 [Umbelopsis isabellina]|nr:hypothetical protein NQZ79_g2521 [Umbelopsis isabellina]